MPGLSDPTADTSELRIELLADQRWIVVRTMARCEKKFAKYCDNLDIRHYLPLRRSVKRYTRKVATHLVPIFPGYVFVQTDPNLKPELLESKLAAHVILTDDLSEPGLVENLKDIRIIEKATLDEEIFVRPEIFVGRTVMVRTGPLTGLSGIVRKLKTKTRITVNVDMVGQSVSLDINANEVELEF